MDEKEQIDHFAKDLSNLIERYRKEYDLSYASAIGVLQLMSFALCKDAAEGTDEKET